MDIKAFPALIVGVVVALVLAGATLPIWADTLATEDTFTNEGYYRMAEYDNTASFTAKWDHTDPNKFTIDGVTYDLPTTQQSIDLNLMCGQSFFLRYNQFSGYAYVQTYGDTIGGSYIARSDNNQDMDVTVSAGSITFDNGGGSPKTVSYTEMYAINGTGDYVLKKPTDRAYMLGDSEIIAIGHSSYNIDTYLTGTIDDGFIRDYRSPSNPGGDVTNFTFGDVVIDDTEITGYNNLYGLLKLTWTATNNDTSTTYDTIYSQFLVPYEVTAERSVSMSGPLGVLVGVLPLLIVAGLVTGAVVWFINRKG